jgi:hypothetical protein
MNQTKMTNKTPIDDDIFDFGFTTVDESELEAIQSAETATASIQDRLDELYNAVLPLLNNLKQNPTKDYIYWPNRIEKVDAFLKKIEKIKNR